MVKERPEFGPLNPLFKNQVCNSSTDKVEEGNPGRLTGQPAWPTEVQASREPAFENGYWNQAWWFGLFIYLFFNPRPHEAEADEYL